tara:strand:- start:144 stop:632 length:489 start_codon:yes stop_codon:yes gene_type:complete
MCPENLEALVVPTGPTYELGIQRAVAGAREYHQRNSFEVVFISGSFEGEKFLGSQVDKIYRTLRREGIPKEDILLESSSTNTMENVLYACEEINNLEIDKIGVVTDFYHADRFLMLFERAKNEGYVSTNLIVDSFSDGIENSYGLIKSKIAYFKDWIFPMKK